MNRSSSVCDNHSVLLQDFPLSSSQQCLRVLRTLLSLSLVKVMRLDDDAVRYWISLSLSAVAQPLARSPPVVDKILAKSSLLHIIVYKSMGAGSAGPSLHACRTLCCVGVGSVTQKHHDCDDMIGVC